MSAEPLSEEDLGAVKEAAEKVARLLRVRWGQIDLHVHDGAVGYVRTSRTFRLAEGAEVRVGLVIEDLSPEGKASGERPTEE